MKFIMRRASIWGNESPCEESKQDTIVRVDKRTFRTPQEFNERCGKREGEWFSVGTNHRISKSGGIARDYGTVDVFSMEINTLEELMKFCEKYGDVIIGNYCLNDDYKEILIYDTYIE